MQRPGSKILQALKREVKESSKPLISRDSVKILTRHNELKLLIDISNSLMTILSGYRNFIPRIYVSPKTFEILEKKKVLENMRLQNF